MSTLTTIVGKSLYFDANILIYASEGGPYLSEALKTILIQIDRGEMLATTSELSLAEVLVKPLRQGNTQLAESYRRRLTDSDSFRVTPISKELLIQAAGLRASFQTLRLPDAIHAATSIWSGCSTFLTNDDRFLGVTDLPVLLLSDLK